MGRPSLSTLLGLDEDCASRTRTSTSSDEAPPPRRLQALRASHHTLAKLVAHGKKDAEVSRITGYAPNYVSRLRLHDPAFKELVLHYQTVEDVATADFLGIAREVAIDAVVELRERLDASPEDFTSGQLLEIAKVLAIEPMKSDALRGAHVLAHTPPVQISFISSKASPLVLEGEKGE